MPACLCMMCAYCRTTKPPYQARPLTPGHVTPLLPPLPSNFHIGLLYDIGCQLEQSCRKWGFLKPFLPRISFAISVFHAFGHQWPCQLIYHPWK
ncbi:hypothetical protein PISMIDRAFT_630896 [Pisolithus microcarpus 441]|uniref:Uncharacterized protein n=1 Tax=Pisolithus microcarpus 441 TaxID=765257 RepID=A0A0C9Z8I7_9AGAM|nr:hypothetical protein BKA83DRAFT_630896 [Pisolithus microcarpus]KIK18712.1 hypothetical protein PISMIDRAFT_630896 [Pisolithus microcarpus 441]